MAGQALMTSETMMAINKPRVNRTAPLAPQANSLSTSGPVRVVRVGGGVLMARSEAFSEGPMEVSLGESVVDTVHAFLLVSVAAGQVFFTCTPRLCQTRP